ncbi:hypothetical protein [uncultured Paracoccus sp.]|uniref:hypothetical protein n=1 Tax=uncultured Paracoccus sp. TaxID=189685 RepID=UPI00260CF92E|nr:hypothetical protein [uncultured Paracoccus sp.]
MSADILSAADGVSSGAREAWRHLATAPLPPDWTRELCAKGFIEHDLRFRRGTDWMFSAVLNEGWVLWYARRPSIRAGLIDPVQMLSAFPAARRKDEGEVKLRLHDAEEAAALLAFCLART